MPSTHRASFRCGLVLLLLTAGCPKSGTSASPTSDPVPGLVSALASGAALAGVLGSTTTDSAACWAYGVASEAGMLAAEVLAARGGVFPDADVDLARCVGLAAEAPASVVVSPLASAAVQAVVDEVRLLLAAYGPALQATDCIAWAYATAAVSYVAGAVEPLLAELAAPDGVVQVPAVAVAECD